MRTPNKNKWLLLTFAAAVHVVIFLFFGATFSKIVTHMDSPSATRYDRSLYIDNYSSLDETSLESEFTPEDLAELDAELNQIDSAARMEVDAYEQVLVVELTRSESPGHMRERPLPFQENLMSGQGSVALSSGSTRKHSSTIQSDTQHVYTIISENGSLLPDYSELHSAVILSYYSIRNGYVRRRVPDTTNSGHPMARLDNVRFNAFNSAHSRDFHTDNLKFQRTVTTGVIHRAVELCPFDLSRV